MKLDSPTVTAIGRESQAERPRGRAGALTRRRARRDNDGAVPKGDFMQTWTTPDHEEIPVSSECTAYAGATR